VASDGEGEGRHSDSQARRAQANQPLHFPCHAPTVAPIPRPFCDVSGKPPPAMSIDRWGPGIGREQRWGPAAIAHSPSPTGDPTPITPDTWGEIESLIETRELRLSTWELTSLANKL